MKDLFRLRLRKCENAVSKVSDRNWRRSLPLLCRVAATGRSRKRFTIPQRCKQNRERKPGERKLEVGFPTDCSARIGVTIYIAGNDARISFLSRRESRHVADKTMRYESRWSFGSADSGPSIRIEYPLDWYHFRFLLGKITDERTV